jgi:hypothetical protein
MSRKNSLAFAIAVFPFEKSGAAVNDLAGMRALRSTAAPLQSD